MCPILIIVTMSKKKTPCALLLNDIHVSKDNIGEFNKNWDEALKICDERNIPEIIIGGDLWQSRSAQNLSTLLAVRAAIQKAQAQDLFLTIAEGNHDLVDQEELLGYSHIFDGYKNVDVIGDYAVLSFSEDLTLIVMSYFPESGSFIPRLNSIIDDVMEPGITNVLYIHQGIKGGLDQPREDELPSKIFEPFDRTLVGHYHDRKKIPGTHIEYIGASRQHNFGEDEEKGYTILFDDGTTEFVKNQANIRFKTIIVNYPDIDNDFLESIKELKKDQRYRLRIKVACYSNEASTVDKQALIDAGASKVEIVTEKVEETMITAQSFDKKYDKSGIKDAYSEFCNSKEIEPELGIEYLNKIS